MEGQIKVLTLLLLYLTYWEEKNLPRKCKGAGRGIHLYSK